MNKIGTLDIIKAYLGNKELAANNAYVGEIELIPGSPTPPGPANDEIWYTSSNGNIVTPYSGAAGALPTIVSNTYSGGKGIIKFAVELTSIGNFAFYQCTGLTSIEIPNSVTSIGDNTFISCSNLTSVTLNSNNIVGTDYTSNKNLKRYFGEQVTEYIIGDSVSSIGKEAFSGCSGLTSVTISNSVTNIGYDAFYQCTGLKSVTIGNSVTSIGAWVFGRCSSLTSISYIGTIAQYNAITKGANWHFNVPATVVHCTDGDTPI